MENIIREYKVGELVKDIKNVLEGAFSYVKVIGEISDFKQSSVGHYYFNLKEGEFLINSVLFRNNILNNGLVLQNGLEVVCYGKLTTYMSRSNYQIIIEGIRINGEGQLKKMVEERKKKLEKEGLFARKRKLTERIRKVGIITSASGAAIKDIEVKLKDRLPIGVFLYPSLVQGNEAGNSIIKGINFFNENYMDLDVIVITRGGGSTEDLMCFNEEDLARAVFASRIPTISAVGHEVDWTIIDFVADLRLPTPTAVGEFLSPLKTECAKRVSFIFKEIIKKAILRVDYYDKKINLLLCNILYVFSKDYTRKIRKLTQLLNEINKFDRKRILKSGYALIERNRKVITYKDDFAEGEDLTVIMYNKKLIVKVL
ncbi:MAG: exodeoxyribonuclease VII large subunit [Rickettsiales bacterium]|jgi:exodeoxyribonuclease VII large subunit|nr:exodeoxyribonuclease VII large subunit [Rickettsiales bacterium]